MCTFWPGFLEFLAMCQFVLAQIVSAASPHTYACVGSAQALQKIHCGKCRLAQGPTHGAKFLVSRTTCRVLEDFRLVELILSVCGVNICIQCTK